MAIAAGKGTAAVPQKAALGSPLRDPGSPGTVPTVVYREACRDRDQFRHERDAACLAAEAATRLKEELDTVKRQRDDLQAKLVDAERQGAAAEARLEVLQRSKGLKHIECGAGVVFPSQSMVPIAPAATFSAHSMQFLASGLLEYGHLAITLLQLYANLHILEDIIVEHFIAQIVSRGPGATDFSMLSTGPSVVIHSVSLPIAVACDSCVFENIIVTHFTELTWTAPLAMSTWPRGSSTSANPLASGFVSLRGSTKCKGRTAILLRG